MVTTLPVLLNTLLYAGIGMIVFAVGFWVLDKLTPGHLWNEIHDQRNIGVAIVTAAMALGLALIIAAAIHG
ncbi:DUF350 domain-containing protein [Sphingomonas qomolangmaensis]|uniref:DUF350 domain-containing protein n=1 Tax=Sphingomonas qomolangmaensis TaxID=2918765 RepID=A0ABY5LAY4_9SPHN|nr:DUF350 domain-containing protein [Sphingomonas qomolangmaensis]UUL81856.1 DUF350 domain-containing protein [Sphingomonas qomolangmaensis]